jgi:SAM-dependent methyltransferase
VKLQVESNLDKVFKDWYATYVVEGDDSYEKFYHHLQEQMGDIPFQGKYVLEVGCGKGAVAFYLSLFSGAKQVIALDEAAGEGSLVGVTQLLKDTITQLGLTNIGVEEIDILENHFPDDCFDVIIANNALHHVVENGFISRDLKSRSIYIRLFQELHRILSPTGVLSIWEYSRLSLWRFVPYKPRKFRMIEWTLHPTVMEWRSVIRQAGFNSLSFGYSVPYKMRKLRWLFANPIAQFIWYPSFFIAARK